MKLGYNITGAERKSLVSAIGEALHLPTRYCGMPSTSYEIGLDYTVDKTGTVTGPDNHDLEDALRQQGFVAATREYDEPITDGNESDETDAADCPDIGQHKPGQYTNPTEPPTEEMLRQAAAWVEGQPEYEDLELTEREELGLGRERREDPQGENGIQASDVPELVSRVYQAELGDPDCPDRMEVFGAKDDEDAIQQAREYCEGEVVLLELLELDEDYNIIRGVDLWPETNRLVIEMPLDGFTPEKLDNLAKLVNAKAPLLKAALGTDHLPIHQTADTLKFPWFGDGLDADTIRAYATLIGFICAAAKEKKRVLAQEKDPENKKYAMRCWLLSLGFIGEEYRVSRKILLSKLNGNSSFKNGPRPKITESEVG